MNLQINLFVYLFALVATFGTVNADDCDVTIDKGRVIGFTSDTLNPDKKICSYLGIPYAAPPVGNLRFKSPQAPKSFGTLNATKLPPHCPQAEIPPKGIKIQEDCLFLNVFQPKIDGVENLSLPVMVFMHGGAFTGGASDAYNAEKLLARGDVILVVPHYRLGVLGFFSTGDYNAPGNYGLKDQAFALRWVKENIKKFGGSPRNVTIFGESAGAASVLFQLVSPLSKGLFSGVIAMSGSTISPASIDKKPAESARLLALFLLCPVWPVSLMVTCIRGVGWPRLLLAQTVDGAVKAKTMEAAMAGIKPVVELPSFDAFMTNEPLELLKTGDIPKVPVMMGATKHDGSLILALFYKIKYGPQQLDKNPDYMRNQLVPDILRYFQNKEDVPNRALSSSVELTYLNGVNRTDWNQVMPGLVDIMTVYAFKSSILNTANILSKRNFPVYLYSFEHHSNNTLLYNSLPNPRPPVDHGIAHADDLLYMFNYPATFSENDKRFSEIFIDMWLAFGKTGNPTPSSDARFEQWPVYNNDKQFFMKLNSTPTVLQDYYTSWRPNGFDWN